MIASAAGSAGEFALWLELWAWSLRDAGLSEARERLDHRWRCEIEKVIRDGQVAGTFGGVDPTEAALAIASLLDGLTVQVRLGESLSPEAMVEVAALVAGRLLDCGLPRPPLVSIEEMVAGVRGVSGRAARGGEHRPGTRQISRRRLLKAGLAAGAGLSASSFLAACSDTTVPGGESPRQGAGRPAAGTAGQPGDAPDLSRQQGDPVRAQARGAGR